LTAGAFFMFVCDVFGPSSAQWIVPEACRLLHDEGQRKALVKLHNAKAQQARPKRPTATYNAPPVTAMGSATATEG
jgi:hypothetical protein